MRVSASIQRWGLIRIFAFSSFISIVTISVVSGYLFFSYLRNNLLQQELIISAEFLQSISLINNHEGYFRKNASAYDYHEVHEFLEHLGRMPDVFRVVAYSDQLEILWSTNPELIGKVYADNHELNEALAGSRIFEEASVAEHAKEEHESIPAGVEQFIETYIPVWDRDNRNVIGVLEIYKSPRAMYKAINEARFLVIVVSLFGAIVLHWVLYWIVQTAHHLIEAQRERIKQATSRAVELNEQNLRRIGSDLHDGPAQSIGFALLRLDSLQEADNQKTQQGETLAKIQTALQDALQEIRDLSAGLIIPELENLSVQEAILKLIDKHEKRTGTRVNYRLNNLPQALRTSIKICVYRLVQEGLNNAFRHGQGIDQSVSIDRDAKSLQVVISDGGPGMCDEDISRIDQSEHLGLRGLRERVESLGGIFRITSNENGIGLQIRANLPLYD